MQTSDIERFQSVIGCAWHERTPIRTKREVRRQWMWAVYGRILKTVILALSGAALAVMMARLTGAEYSLALGWMALGIASYSASARRWFW